MGKNSKKHKNKAKQAVKKVDVSTTAPTASGHHQASALAPSTTTTSTPQLPLPFPSHLPRPPNHDFLLDQSPYQKSFRAALTTSYQGFVVDDKLSMAESDVQQCLEEMQTQQYFRRDVTQPFGLGTKCAKTYVTRCLVGDPGTTYKYLGLRMFAHPWSLADSKAGGSSKKTAKTLQTTSAIYKLKELLSERTKTHLKELDEKRRHQGIPPTLGRSDFDICLINRMDPAQEGLKPESSQLLPHLGTSVSWHADSSLEHYSTIAVYQTLLPVEPSSQNKKKNTKKTASPDTDQWYVAMRVTPHCEGPMLKRKTHIESTIDKSIPPIAVSLPSGSAYYMLDDFNHHHQHAVLRSNVDAKSCIRYSCTYRLLRDSHNVDYMLQRCRSAVSHFHKKGSKLWRSEQLLLTELESEWIRQFYIQGSQHHELLWDIYWKEPMEQLLQYWSQLEHRTLQTYDLLQHAAQGKCLAASSTTPPPPKAERKLREKQKKALVAVQGLFERSASLVDSSTEATELFGSFADLLQERAEMRELWSKREQDHVFTELSAELRPMPLPFGFADDHESADGVTSPLPGSPSKLKDMATMLRSFGRAFVSGQTEDLPAPAPLPVKRAKASAQQSSRPDSNDDTAMHSKPLDWKGWKQEDCSFGLELQDPWAAAVINGRKQIETRAYDLPPALIGKRIWILESPSGTAGVSAMGDTINLADSGTCKVIGWCRFTSVIEYKSAASFQADESRHLVSANSGYAWKEGKTKVIYGWVVGECGHVTKGISFSSATRRMRSLFELNVATVSGVEHRHHKRKATRDGKHNSFKEKKKRWRY